jgi:transcriptional regulator with XRE-family HTH domain
MSNDPHKIDDAARDRFSKKIGENIKSRRLALGLTQYDVADKVLTRQCVVSYWERGKNLPHLDSLYFLAKALQCTIFDLLEGV